MIRNQQLLTSSLSCNVCYVRLDLSLFLVYIEKIREPGDEARASLRSVQRTTVTHTDECIVRYKI